MVVLRRKMRMVFVFATKLEPFFFADVDKRQGLVRMLTKPKQPLK